MAARSRRAGDGRRDAADVRSPGRRGCALRPVATAHVPASRRSLRDSWRDARLVVFSFAQLHAGRQAQRAAMSTRKARSWLAGVAIAATLALAAVRCDKAVDLGVDPGSDAGGDAGDAAVDAGAVN